MEFLRADISQRYPELMHGESQVQFIIAGIGGEQAFEGLKRLPALLKQYKPTVCVVNYGTCEVTFKNEKSFIPAMQEIVDQLRAANVATTIVTPPPCSPENWQMTEWPASQFVKALPIVTSQAKKLAKRESLVVADAFRSLIRHQKGGGAELTTDGIHLNQAGYRLMADLLQQAWGYGRPLA